MHIMQMIMCNNVLGREREKEEKYLYERIE